MENEKKFELNQGQIIQLMVSAFTVLNEYQHQLFLYRLNFLNVKQTPHPGTFKEFSDKYQSEIIEKLRKLDK